MKKKIIVSLILVQSIFIFYANAANIYVNPGDNLNSKIESANGGDVLIISPGTYAPVSLTNKNLSSSNPLLIKSNGLGTVTIMGFSNSSGNTVDLTNCSYLIFEDIVIDSGLRGVYIKASDHIIIKNSEIKNTGQEGIHIGQSSSYVDVIENHIHNTGTYNSQWGEGIYVGTGSYSSVTFPDNCEYIWIENNEIHDCGNGEAINVKAECFHVTIRGNTIYNIAPGTSSQYNQAAVSFEGANISEANNYRLTENRDFWLENNEIYNVSGGYSNWDNGAMLSGIGVHVVGNNIHDCDDKGIYGNSYATLDLPIYIYNNTLSSNGQDLYINGGLTNVHYTDPGSNPNVPQSWFGSSQVSVTGVTLNQSSISLSAGATSQLTETVSPSNASNKTVSWSSSNTSVATVNSNGVVTAMSDGSATITVTTIDGGFTDNCSVTVNGTSGSLKYEAEEGTLSGVTVESSLPGYSGTGYIARSSFDSNDDVIAVSVNASSAGNYTLYIGYNATSDKRNDVYVNNVNVSDNLLFPETQTFTELAGLTIPLNGGNNTVEIRRSWGQIDVDYFRIEGNVASEPVTSVALNSSSITMGVGETNNLMATVSPSNASDQSLSWSSSNTSVATVSGSGQVTAVSAGSATITVITNDGGFTDNCVVTVSSSSIAVTGVSLNQSSLSISEGASSQLTETVSPTNATNKTVSWSSSNTSVASVNSSGLVITGSAGSATITVTTNDGGFTDNCLVTVNTSSGYTIYEAEDGILSGVTIESSISGFSGTGYIARNSFNANDDVISVEVDAPYAGDYTLHIGYRAPSEKRNDVYVNNVNVGNELLFPESQTFTELAGLTIPLNSGNNIVEIRKSWGWIDIDYFKVMGSGLKQAQKPAVQYFNEKGLKIYPNPTLDQSFTIDLTDYSNQVEFSISICDISGKTVCNKYFTGNQLYHITNLQSTGLFFVKVQSSDFNFIEKIVVQ